MPDPCNEYTGCDCPSGLCSNPKNKKPDPVRQAIDRALLGPFAKEQFPDVEASYEHMRLYCEQHYPAYLYYLRSTREIALKNLAARRQLANLRKKEAT